MYAREAAIPPINNVFKPDLSKDFLTTLPMHIQCIKEIYLMIMNGQLGAMDETYLSKRKTNIVILASIVAIVLVKSIFFRITILMLLLTGSKIHPLNH